MRSGLLDNSFDAHRTDVTGPFVFDCLVIHVDVLRFVCVDPFGIVIHIDFFLGLLAF
jgi:hypothetical protein